MSVLAWLPGMAQAQSACTAIWGISTVTATTGELRYLNTTTNLWSAPVVTLTGFPNALAGSSANGLLYYVDRNTQQLYSIDQNTNPLTSVLVGTIPAPPAPALGVNVLGSTTDAAGNLFVYATSANVALPNYSFVTVAQISVSTAATITPWTQIVTTTGGTATLGSSGDSFVDGAGNNWVISNTNPPTLHRLDLNPGASFGRTNTPALSLTGVDAMNVAAVSTDPLTGLTYLGGFTGATAAAPYSSVTFQVDLVTGATVALPQTDTNFRITDMGNCAFKPARPTVAKSFTPAFKTTSPGTTTLLITLGNSNSVPTYLNNAFVDSLPAGMTVSATPLLQGSCIVAGNLVTAAASANTISVSAGSRIPAGGCTISVLVNASVDGVYVNTIPAGGLNTTAGTNAAQAQATFQVGVNDFSINKQQRTGSGAFTAGPLSVPGGATLQYALIIANGAGSASAGTVTFTDILPPLITPPFSVVANATGGVCTTANAVVGGITQVTGTFTNAPIGGVCTVTITGRASVTAVLTTFPNTASLGPVAPTIDSSSFNNTTTVATTILPVTTLTLAKTNGITNLVAGSTTSYTITASNLGPSAADGAIVKDSIAAGLNCVSVSCTTTGGAACPGAPISLAAFQASGIPISPFPAASTASFVLVCGVTATGQ